MQVVKDTAKETESFEILLDWLDPDRELAGEKYEQIRTRLLKIFYARGCHLAEELADDTIERVTRKVGQLIGTYDGDPAYYFYGVAKNVFKEFTRKPKSDELPDTLVQAESNSVEKEENDRCLTECLSKLTRKNSEFILEYYQRDKQAKIDCRKRMMDRLDISHEALRIRAYRIRNTLQKCVLKCLKENRM